jgi:formylglycine-generating enzyme required for sulfatase activity
MISVVPRSKKVKFESVPSTTPPMITGDTMVGPAPTRPGDGGTPVSFPLPEGPVTQPVTPEPPPAQPVSAVPRMSSQLPPPRGGAASLLSSRNVIIGAAAVAVLSVFGVLFMRSTSQAQQNPAASKAPEAAVVAKGTAPSQPVPASPEPASSTSPTPQPAAAEVAATPRCPEGMVYVEGGKFFMGTDDQGDIFKFSRPARQVEVGPFCIGINEVSVGEYRQCSGVGECKRAFKDSQWPQGNEDPDAWNNAREAYSVLCNERYDQRLDHPVNCVTWEQAKSYCEFKGWRLPKEAEWEFAARGSDGRVYSWGDEAPAAKFMNGCGSECRQWRSDAGLDPGSVLHESNDSFAGTAPVGSFPAGVSANGLNDMAGNVWEWVEEPFVMPGDDVANAHGRRVIRGGGFNSYRPEHATPALRFGQAEDAHLHAIGFRCVAEPQ